MSYSMTDFVFNDDTVSNESEKIIQRDSLVVFATLRRLISVITSACNGTHQLSRHTSIYCTSM
jgi:hypothetical protein